MLGQACVWVGPGTAADSDSGPVMLAGVTGSAD
jgi:hypothetical protein